jgi:Fe-Mn family superoxide dismutase
MQMTRRTLLCLTGGATVALVSPSLSQPATAQTPPAAGPFVLPALPYPAAALEPHIDAQTMTIHHDRHHQAYVTNLNAAIAKSGAAASASLDVMLRRLDTVPEAVRTAVRNNGGGHANHMQFWTLLSPKGGGAPTGAIADALRSTFGSVDSFKEQFAAAAASRFGSGWAWLSDDGGKLVIHSTANQDTPSMEGKRAIFGLDVWEHAYYLKYQNRRADYITAFWNVVDWNEVNRRLKG